MTTARRRLHQQRHLPMRKCREMPLAHADQARNSNIAMARFNATILLVSGSLVSGLVVPLDAPYLKGR
jgi:hypothetical protein